MTLRNLWVAIHVSPIYWQILGWEGKERRGRIFILFTILRFQVFPSFRFTMISILSRPQNLRFALQLLHPLHRFRYKSPYNLLFAPRRSLEEFHTILGESIPFHFCFIPWFCLLEIPRPESPFWCFRVWRNFGFECLNYVVDNDSG